LKNKTLKPVVGVIVGVAEGIAVGVVVGVVGGVLVGVAVGVTACTLEIAFDETVLVELLAVDGVGDAVGPLHPAAITQKSNTAHTANVTVRFFVKLTPRRSDGSLRMQKDLLQHT
jgi:hypothetical protein